MLEGAEPLTPSTAADPWVEKPPSEDFQPTAVTQQPPAKESNEGKAGLIIKVSLMVALAWWGFGLFAVVKTKSLAVLASLVDTTIDLLAQGVLLISNKLAESGALDEEYPAGIARMEPMGVVICAVLMVLSALWVIYDAVVALTEDPELEFTAAAQVMLAVVVVAKVVVWRIADSEYKRSGNVSLEALALDNFNDILSNALALVFASLTMVSHATWWLDPVGGILISLYIIRSWVLVGLEKVGMLLGKRADDEFLDSVKALASSHDAQAELANVRAYHFGPKLIVEIGLIMDSMTTLQVCHDVVTSLQDQVERLEDCERCFVHIDHECRQPGSYL